MSVFRGSGVALVTPFHEDKSINFEMLEYLVERQIANYPIQCAITDRA